MAYRQYGVITDRVDVWAWIGLGLFGVECVVLLIQRMSCPLTLVALRYSDSGKPNIDIYLPEWLARYNKLIHGVLLAVVTASMFLRAVA